MQTLTVAAIAIGIAFVLLGVFAWVLAPRKIADDVMSKIHGDVPHAEWER